VGDSSGEGTEGTEAKGGHLKRDAKDRGKGMQSLVVVRKGGRIPRRRRSFARSGPLLGPSPSFDGSVRPWGVHDPQRIPSPPFFPVFPFEGRDWTQGTVHTTDE